VRGRKTRKKNQTGCGKNRMGGCGGAVSRAEDGVGIEYYSIPKVESTNAIYINTYKYNSYSCILNPRI
jgi:hypothetical protein